VERYEIDVAFEPERGFLRAKAAVTLRASGGTDAIEFELNPALTIQEITDAQGRKLAFDRSRRLGSPRLLVRLAEPVAADAADQSLTLTFVYEGVPQLPGLDYINKDGILLRDEARWYPALDLAAFTENGYVIHLPTGWQVTDGSEAAAKTGFQPSGLYAFRPARRSSSRSLVAFPTREPSGKDCLLLRMSHGPEYEVMACMPWVQQPQRLQEDVHRILGALESAFGKYPSRYFSIVLGFPGQRGAIGYSAPGFVVVSEDAVKWQGVRGYSSEFLPHEIAHQWFPIEVTLARQEDGWLAESLAEYLAWRYLQETSLLDAKKMVARAMRDSLAHEPLRPVGLGLRLFGLEEWDVTYATLYQRGMLVWRTLETVIGRQRVDAALREYYKRFAGRSASVANFRKICEEISERDLGWFFDYYIGGTRTPEIELHRLPGGAPGELLGEIVVRDAPPEFTARVEVRIHTTTGAVDHSVATRDAVTPFSLNVSGQVTGITLDPDARILRWTEAARSNRRQRQWMASLGALERARQFTEALEVTQRALEADPQDLAANEQQIRFARGRLYDRLRQYTRAMQEFGRVLELSSHDQPSTDLFRAWARVYRARIERRRGNMAAAQAEANAGIAINAPALDTEVTWPDSPEKKTTAAQELRALAK
jgi:tetratricopeptide (TPR) repeat protein